MGPGGPPPTAHGAPSAPGAPGSPPVTSGAPNRPTGGIGSLLGELNGNPQSRLRPAGRPSSVVSGASTVVGGTGNSSQTASVGTSPATPSFAQAAAAALANRQHIAAAAGTPTLTIDQRLAADRAMREAADLATGMNRPSRRELNNRVTAALSAVVQAAASSPAIQAAATLALTKAQENLDRLYPPTTPVITTGNSSPAALARLRGTTTSAAPVIKPQDFSFPLDAEIAAINPMMARLTNSDSVADITVLSNALSSASTGEKAGFLLASLTNGNISRVGQCLRDASITPELATKVIALAENYRDNSNLGQPRKIKIDQCIADVRSKHVLPAPAQGAGRGA